MLWLTVSVVGFLLLTALVIALARRSTARWEREKRAARAPVFEDATPPTAGARAAARLHAGLARTAATVGHGAVRTRALPQAVSRMLARPVEAVTRLPAVGRIPAGTLRRIARRSAASGTGAGDEVPADAATGDGPDAPEGTDGALPPDPTLLGESPTARRGLRRGTAPRGWGHVTRRLPRRLAVRLMHRHEEQAAQKPWEDADESTPAS